MIFPFFLLSAIFIILFIIAHSAKNLVNNYYGLKIFRSDILDFFLIIYFIIFVTLIFQIILPAKFLLPILIISAAIFLIFDKKKFFIYIKKKYLIFCLIFVVLFFSISNSPIYDTMLYHGQIINWLGNFAVGKNLTLIDQRLGQVSPWHLFISIFNYKINNYNLSNLINYIPFLILIFQTLQIKKNKIILVSDIFLINSCLFILYFSYIHPFGNGIFLMSLGSIGTDLPAAIFFIFSFYFFIKFFEDKKNELSNFIFLLVCCSLATFSRINYITIYLLVLVILVYKKDRTFFLYSLVLTLPIFLLFIFKNYIVSGCLLYPVYFTCNVYADFSLYEIAKNYYEIIQSFNRSGPSRETFGNYEITNYSYLWFKEWFLGFFLQTSIFQITYFLIIFSFFKFLFDYFRYKPFFHNRLIFNSLTVVFLFSNFFLLSAPSVRFAYGFIIAFSMYNLTLLNMKIIHKFFNISKFFILLGLLLISLKNYKNYEYFFYLSKSHQYDYSSLKFISQKKNINLFYTNTNDGFCYDVKDICLKSDYIDFKLDKILFYNISVTK